MVWKAILKDAVPGIVYGILWRFSDLKNCCLSECPKVLCIEKVLTNIAFVMGYGIPSRLVWLMIRRLLEILAKPLVDHYLEDDSLTEVAVRGILSLLEQIGIAKVWDAVSDASICMRRNNCRGDFFGQLINIKISNCNVTLKVDENRPLSTCEKIFNDSPLIMLAIVMVILMLLAWDQLDKPNPPNPPGDPPPAPPISSPGGSGGTAPGWRSDSVFFSYRSTMNKNQSVNVTSRPISTQTQMQSHRQQINKSSNNTVNSSPSCCQLCTNNSFNAPPSPSEENSPNTKSTQTSPMPPCPPPSPPPPPPPPPPTQVIHAKCPGCCKTFNLTIPKPWRLCCSPSLPASASDMDRLDRLTKEVLEKVFKEVDCKYCKHKVRKVLKATLKSMKEAKKKEENKDNQKDNSKKKKKEQNKDKANDCSKKKKNSK